ncbi:hypothetical protein FRX31_014918 [Thalictrum thalictroides]|uniref:CCHC-type domain-containing protein n=1 Tax=Thalictrum thalictroides TaxID=46969 RepID=A0A7J6WGG5_THATH|nr:hypothetical protein FRX31_014918 [Thalictrum thalictroides]
MVGGLGTTTKDKEWRRIWITTDSAAAAKAFNIGNVHWRIKNDLNRNKDGFEWLNIANTWREENFSADVCTNKGAILQKDTKFEKKVGKFICGLSYHLQVKVLPSEQEPFERVMSLTLRMEQLENEFRDSRAKTKTWDHGKNTKAYQDDKNRVRYRPYEPKDFDHQRGYDRRRGYDRPRDNDHREDYRPRGNDRESDRVGQGDRARTPIVCYECSQPGHIARNCPRRQPRPEGQDRRPTAAGRVYAAIPPVDGMPCIFDLL